MMPTLVKVATPATALMVVLPTMEASPSPPLTVMVTEAVLVVTMLPKVSLIVITGWVVNAEPLAEPTALLVSVTWVAVPKVGVMLWVAVVKEPEVKVRV